MLYEDEAPAGLQDAAKLGEPTCGIRDGTEDKREDNVVKDRVVKREILNIHFMVEELSAVRRDRNLDAASESQIGQVQLVNFREIVMR